MLGDDPPYLSVGTEVSAKYKGAFCEAKIRKVVRSVKCRVTYKQGLGTATVADDQIKGVLRVGASVEAKHSDKKDYVEATITKIQDCSQYTVVFDDGDITTLRRTALCLKSGRHFAESETLDQLPLTHPEHFGNPVIGGRRGRRSRQAQDDSSDDEGSPPRGMHDSASGGSGKEGMETEPEIGRVVCVELGDKKKKDNWFPGLVVAPTAQDTVRIRVRDDYLVRSFKDARYYTVPKKEATEFTKELVNKIENSALKVAVEKALLFLEKNELPPHWDRDLLFGNVASSGNSDSDGELDSDSSDDEPREEKDHFVAQLYKFMDDRGTPINNCPMIGNEDIDLYRLFRAVYKMGGYNRVTNQNQWKSVTRRLSFSMHSNSSTYNLVKQAYKKFLHSFEDFYRKLGCTMVNHPRGSMRKQRPGRSLIRDKDRNTPVPLAVARESKTEKEEEERESKDESTTKKKAVEEEKKESKKKETSKPEEETVKPTKKKQAQPLPEEEEESVSEKESDINVDAEEESSSSEKSQKRSSSVMKNRTKYRMKEKDETKKKPTEKRTKNSESRVEKKEDRSKDKEEDSAKTRSKSKEDAVSKKSDKDGSETGSVVGASASSGKEAEKTEKPEKSEKSKASKQKRMSDEELKKRGRKRKDQNEGDKRSTEEKEYNAACYKGPIKVGDRLRVYYGPNHEMKVTYDAKVVDVDQSDPNSVLYLVHYLGWNTRYDEWIKASRISQNFTQTQVRVKRTKSTPRPQTPSSTKSSSDSKSKEKTPGGERGKRRAQSVAPSSEKKDSDAKKESNEKESEKSTRSSTPTSSFGARTKSPAVPLGQRSLRGARHADSADRIELRRRVRKVSGQTDVSMVPSDSEESQSYESDTTEPEQEPKSKAKSTPREARKRAESRIKVEADNSDIEPEKESEEPRRGRRLRRTLGKIQPDVKSEPESDEEQPKGRDFDLNQIRSELKGFDKAVKMDVLRLEQTPTTVSEEPAKSEKEGEAPPALAPIAPSPKPEKKPEVKTEPAEPKEESTEDIYEFKEPEPFEFEVRNKRDFNSEKDKLKKRPFEEEKPSPKKKPKVAAASPKENKQETEIPSAEYKKRSRKNLSKAKEEVTVSPSRQSTMPCEEAFDKMCESNAQIKKEVDVPTQNKISTNLNLLFNEIPTENDESKERPVKEESTFIPKEQPTSANEDTKIDKGDIKPKPEKEETGVKGFGETKAVADVKTVVKVTPAVVEKSAPTPTSIPSVTQDAKSFEYISPMLAPSVTAAIPIAARLPATSSIEEKLSAAAAVAYGKRDKDSKKDDETEALKKQSKKNESPANAEPTVRKGGKKYSSKEDTKKTETEAEKPILPDVKRLETKEELKKEALEMAKITSAEASKKLDKSWMKIDNQGLSVNWESALEKGKALINQEFADSTDSSDSERRLVIDNEEFQEDKRPPSFEKPFIPKQESEPEKEKKVVPSGAKSSRNDEDRENLNSLLCEEEIPGSPTSELEEKEEPCPMLGNRTSPKANENALASLMEMPFASAPTSSSEQSKACESSATMSVALPAGCRIPPLGQINPSAQPQPEPLPIAAPHPDSNEAAPVMDNTPPTTPDSSISNISESPREERTGGSSPMSEDNSNLKNNNRDSSENEHDPAKRPEQAQPADPEGSLMAVSMNLTKPPAKRPYEESPSPKKRKRSRKHSETGGGSAKKPVRQSAKNGRGLASDSDDTCESSNLYVNTSNVSSFSVTAITANTVASTVTTAATTTVTSTTTVATPTNNTTDHGNYSSRSPKPMKYNFYVELDPELDGSQRIAVLQQKLSELRKTYNAVKVELAAIERRRKKLKRREREAMKAAKAEMQQACS